MFDSLTIASIIVCLPIVGAVLMFYKVCKRCK